MLRYFHNSNLSHFVRRSFSEADKNPNGYNQLGKGKPKIPKGAPLGFLNKHDANIRMFTNDTNIALGIT